VRETEEVRKTERVRNNVWVGLISSLVCWYGKHGMEREWARGLFGHEG
jgi:hypothetical protein